MLGLRAFPDTQGGVEKHAENLARELVALGCQVEAIVRSPYVAKGRGRTWQGVIAHLEQGYPVVVPASALDLHCCRVARVSDQARCHLSPHDRQLLP